MTDAPATCPCCGADFRGEPIPEEMRAHYHPDSTHFTRVLGKVDEARDLVVAWECPDCGHRWPRE